jgi:hypothetical protein
MGAVRCLETATKTATKGDGLSGRSPTQAPLLVLIAPGTGLASENLSHCQRAVLSTGFRREMGPVLSLCLRQVEVGQEGAVFHHMSQVINEVILAFYPDRSKIDSQGFLWC